MRMVGRVVHFSRRGFGLIEAAETGSKGSQLFFVHVRDVPHQREVPVGTKVSFEVAPPTPEHPNRAVRVEMVMSGPVVLR